MLRQLARLSAHVPSAGGRSLAVAVYADSADTPVRAQEAGYEGVACVDDAARALEVYCDLWDATRLPWALRWCEGLVDFIIAMQDPDGRWVNFILDWDGTPNRSGRTSVAGGGFWQARALLALARASRTLPDDRIRAALARGMPHILTPAPVSSDVRCLHVMTVLALLQSSSAGAAGERLTAWCEEIAGCRRGDVLMNSHEERGHPHLWGHVQEAVLADAGTYLHRDDLVSIAVRSAESVFVPAIGTGFAGVRTQPYDVACAVHVMSRLAAVTGQLRYAALASDSRAWFDGRNPSGQPVYDRSAGRVADGVDGAEVNTHSGAESNIVGAQALFDEVVGRARTLPQSELVPRRSELIAPQPT